MCTLHTCCVLSNYFKSKLESNGRLSFSEFNRSHCIKQTVQIYTYIPWHSERCNIWISHDLTWLCKKIIKRIFLFKNIDNVVLTDSSYKDDNARFTTVPLKALADQLWIRYQCLSFRKLIIFNCRFYTKVTCAFLL